jgi:hypothetical protein
MREPALKPKVALALAYVLLLAQWTGFGMVLCVSGADHVRFELLNAACCAPGASHDAGRQMESGKACRSCQDVDLQSASFWDPPRHADIAEPGAINTTPVVAADEAVESFHPHPALQPSTLAPPLRC